MANRSSQRARLAPAAVALTAALQIAGLSSAAHAAPAADDHFGDATYAGPAGWSRADDADYAVYTPPSLPAGKAVNLCVWKGAANPDPAAPLFAASVDLFVKHLDSPHPSPVDETRDADGGETFHQTVMGFDQGGAGVLMLFVGHQHAGRFEFAYLTTNDGENNAKYLQAYIDLDKSLTFGPPQATPAGGGGTGAAHGDAAAAAVDKNAAAPQVALAPPQQSERYIEGWYAATWMFNDHLVAKFYWFRPDGGVYFGTPDGGTTDADFAALVAADASKCGTYGIRGQKMVLQHNGGAAKTVDYLPNWLDGAVLRPIVFFEPGRRLDGRWTQSMYARGAGGLNAAAAHSWQFNADGTFEGGSVTSVSKGAAGLGASKSTKGTYEITGHQVRLTYDDGAVASVEIAGTNDKDQPYVLCVGAAFYVR